MNKAVSQVLALAVMGVTVFIIAFAAKKGINRAGY